MNFEIFKGPRSKPSSRTISQLTGWFNIFASEGEIFIVPWAKQCRCLREERHNLGIKSCKRIQMGLHRMNENERKFPTARMNQVFMFSPWTLGEHISHGKREVLYSIKKRLYRDVGESAHLRTTDAVGLGPYWSLRGLGRSEGVLRSQPDITTRWTHQIGNSTNSGIER